MCIIFIQNTHIYNDFEITLMLISVQRTTIINHPRIFVHNSKPHLYSL